MKKFAFLPLVFSVLFTLNSCQKLQQLPATPHIQFTSFTVFDTTDILGNHSKGGTLRFHFEDGDGDVGLNVPTDATGNQPDTSNLFLSLLRKVNGSLVPAPDNDPLKPSNYRIPYMERLGRDKILKGTISVTFLYLFYSPTDTIAYSFYIKDRALNESNVETTTPIVLSVNKVYN
jgi:hypothetical protein